MDRFELATNLIGNDDPVLQLDPGDPSAALMLARSGGCVAS